MANTQVLLIKPVENLGNEADQVSVKAGYARNWLLPEGYAIHVTKANKKQVEALLKAKQERLAKELEGAQAMATSLNETAMVFQVKVGEENKMFGSVTVSEIVEKLETEYSLKIEKKRVKLAHPIKELGEHTVEVKLPHDIKAEIKLTVIAIEEEAK